MPFTEVEDQNTRGGTFTPISEERVYREDTGDVISAPSNIPARAVEYLDDVQNNGADSGLGFTSVASAAATGVGMTVTGIASEVETGFMRQTGEASRAVFAGEEPELSIWGLMMGSTTDHAIVQSRLAKMVFGDDFVKEAGVKQAERLIDASKNIKESNDKFIQENFPKEEGALGVVQDVFGGFTTILASIGLSVATKSPAASTALFSEIQENAIFNESMERGFNNLDARDVATSAKVMEGGLEAIGGASVLQIFKNSKGVVRHVGVAVQEGIQEALQTGGEAAITQSSGVRDVDVEGAARDMAYAGFIGMIGGGTSSAVISTISKVGQDAGMDKGTADKVAENIQKKMPEINNEVITALEDQVSPLKDSQEAEAQFAEKAREVFKPEPTDEKRIAANARVDEISQALIEGDNRISEIDSQLQSDGIIEGTQEHDALISEKKSINKEKRSLNDEISNIEGKVANDPESQIEIDAAIAKADQEEFILGGIEDFAKESGFSINREEAIRAFELEQAGVDLNDAFVHIEERRAAEVEAETIRFEDVEIVRIEDSFKEMPSVNEEFVENVEDVSDQETGLVSNKMSTPKGGFLRDFGVGIERALTPISTRVKNISPKLFNRFRRFEFDLKRAVIADHNDVLPFLKSIQKLDKDTWIALDLAMKNGREDIINDIAVANNMVSELAAVKDVLDSIFTRATDVGMDIKYRWDFFPRRVKDIEGLIDHVRGTKHWSVIKEAIDTREKKLDRPLDNQERVVVINNLLKGFKVEGVSLAKKGVFKDRTIEKVTSEINQFYETSDQALLSYITIANDAIETSKLFGKGQDIDGANNVEDSIGFFVNDLVNKDEISTRQASVLKEIFAARFNSGRMGYITSAIRDLTYIDVMGSPLNAITQIGDLATSMYNSGIIRTATALPSAITNKGKVSLTDVGVEHIAEEFSSGSFTSNSVSNVFKLNGLQKIDSVGKLTLVNSDLSKMQKQAKKNDSKLISKLDLMFGVDSDQVLNDLRNGEITDDVRFVLFNTLLDMQPMAKSEMPQYYLTNGNLKILYMLKTFTIRQLDIYRREVFSQIVVGTREGDAAKVSKALGNFVRLAGFWITMGASADYMKDFVRSFFGEDETEEAEDYVYDNILKAFGFSRYQLNMVAKTSPIEVGQQMFLPPAKFLINVSKDFRRQAKDGLDLNNSRAIRSMPIGGELYYFWFGGASASDDGKSTRRRGRGGSRNRRERS